MRRKRHKLRGRRGRPTGRLRWRVYYEGRSYGTIMAHDYAEALTIARDGAPETWDNARVEVELA